MEWEVLYLVKLETIKKNIGLINKLFNLRLNICDGKYLLHK